MMINLKIHYIVLHIYNYATNVQDSRIFYSQTNKYEEKKLLNFLRFYTKIFRSYKI